MTLRGFRSVLCVSFFAFLLASPAVAQRDLTILAVPYGSLSSDSLNFDPDTAPIRIDIHVFNHMSFASLTRLEFNDRRMSEKLECNCITEDLYIVFRGEQGIWVPTLPKSDYSPSYCRWSDDYDGLPQNCPKVIITNVKAIDAPADSNSPAPWRPNLKLNGKIMFFEALLVLEYPGTRPFTMKILGRVEECDGPCR